MIEDSYFEFSPQTAEEELLRGKMFNIATVVCPVYFKFIGADYLHYRIALRS